MKYEISRLQVSNTKANQQLEKERKIIRVNRVEPAEDLPTVKSLFLSMTLSMKSGWIVVHIFTWWSLVSFIESLEWVYLLGATIIRGDVWP